MTGFMRMTADGVVVTLEDQFGFRMRLTGVRSERDGVAGWVLTGGLVHVPESLRIPGLDDDAGAD